MLGRNMVSGIFTERDMLDRVVASALSPESVEIQQALDDL